MVRVVVVGGGPAGLMAAEVMARAGCSVTVFEHMASVGRKFLLAGRGGLNITHTEELDDLLDRYGPARGRLESAVAGFGPDDVRSWCAGLGEPTFVGSSGRVFPESFRATPLLRAWLRRLDDLGVEIRTRHRWSDWAPTSSGAIDPHRHLFTTGEGATVEVTSEVTILAFGGASWPRVGSDGRWVTPVAAQGLTVEPLRPANCGVVVGWSEHLVRLAGTPLKNVAVTVDDRSVRGDVMITTSGLEGGPIYAHSAAIRTALERDGHATVFVDVQPDLDEDRLVERFARRRAKDSASTRLGRSGLRREAVALVRDVTANRIPADLRELAGLVKALPVGVDDLMPIDRAISSAGGVRFDELDEHFMVRRHPGLFVAGEMIDWEAPTGGYLLQATLSTAVAAAEGALAWAEIADNGRI